VDEGMHDFFILFCRRLDEMSAVQAGEVVVEVAKLWIGNMMMRKSKKKKRGKKWEPYL